MAWSPQQDAALKAVAIWLLDRNGRQVFRLFGFAGTGKTTLAIEIGKMVRGIVLYATFTGKAALVMRSKGCENATTIHSLIYKPIEGLDGEPIFELNRESILKSASLLIVDEVSMVGDELGVDLVSFGTKILVLGDPAQLPPISGAGFFTDMKPDVMLTEIHRQAKDNPIIRLSMDVREGRKLCVGAYGDSKIITRRHEMQADVLKADQVLCGLNRTRRSFNARIRLLNNFTGAIPQEGERLVCLKNKRERGLLNGGLWRTQSSQLEGSIVTMKVQSEDDDTSTGLAEVDVPIEYFEGSEDKLDSWYRRKYDEFTYGYALTCHKSQGSQWRSVVLFDESPAFKEHRMNHLYTGITRAAERITIVI